MSDAFKMVSGDGSGNSMSFAVEPTGDVVTNEISGAPASYARGIISTTDGVVEVILTGMSTSITLPVTGGMPCLYAIKEFKTAGTTPALSDLRLFW